MTYEDLIDLVEGGAPTDWLRGAHGSLSTAVNLKDLNARFEVDWDRDVMVANFVEEWTQKLPNRKASSYSVRLCYGATVVERLGMVAVDGGTYLIPMPDDPASGAVSRKRWIAAVLLGMPDTEQQVERYMKAAGWWKS
jgi:hypothetical protein